MEYCCTECFNPELKTLVNYITRNGEIGDCSCCGSQNVPCIAPEELEELFIPLVSLYEIIENFMPLEDLKSWDGAFIWEKLDQDWWLFSDKLDYQDKEALIRAIFVRRNTKDGDNQFLESYVEMEDEYWGSQGEVSRKLGSEWDAFCQEIKYKNRYFVTRVIDLELLRELLAYQEEFIDVGLCLYRGRLGNRARKIDPSRMGKPPIEMSQHGRANPAGIPYLYVASDVSTAIAEKRPFVNDRITVGDFLVKSPLKVVDLRDPTIEDPFMYGDRLAFIVDHLGFLRKLGFELSKTISRRESDIEYIPLQYLCEFIKICGYDGVIYESSVAEGHNLAIFADDKLECTNTNLYEIEKIQYEYSKR